MSSDSLQPRPILVVDDNPADRENVILNLHEIGQFDQLVQVASTVAEAKEKIRGNQFDLILLDLGLPDSVGLSALNEIRIEIPNTPIIILSGRKDAEIVDQAMREGAQDYLSKNELSAEYLDHAIRFALERSLFDTEKAKMFEELRSLADAVPGVLHRFQVDAMGNRSMPFVSSRVHDYFAVSSEEVMADYTCLYQEIHPDDVEQLMAATDRMVERSEDFEQNIRVRVDDNDYRIINIHSEMEFKDDGSRVWTGIMVDRTEEMRNQEEMKRLSLVAARTDTAVIITDPKGITLWTNPGFEKLTGYSLEDLKGKKPGDVLQGPETDPKAVSFISERVASGEPFKTEILNYHKDGTPVWLSLNVQTTCDSHDELEFFIAVQTNITERKLKEDELARRAALLEAAGEVSGLGAWEYIPKSGEVRWTKQSRIIHELDEDYQPSLETALDFYPDPNDRKK